MQRNKGRSYEQSIAILLRAAYPDRIVRRALQAHRPYEPDVIVDGVPLWWECQDAINPDPPKKMKQAIRDLALARQHGRDYRIPIVVWHRIRERKVWATLSLADLVALEGAGEAAEPASESVLVTLEFSDLLALKGLRSYARPE